MQSDLLYVAQSSIQEPGLVCAEHLSHSVHHSRTHKTDIDKTDNLSE